MRDVDTLLHEAGARWRAGQPQPPDVDGRAFTARRDRTTATNLLAIGAAGVGVLLVVGLAATGFDFRRAVGGPSPVGSAPGSSGPQACDVTRPTPPFVAPSPYPASPPAGYDARWYGSSALWTMLPPDGEVWRESDLPQGPGGLTQKTFWWSAERTPQDDLEPAITVTGTRLDGPGTFESGPGTNASADFGPAMLVGIEFPTAGCWQLTGRYRDAVLSYVVWITDD